jgi:endonuclease/exonuclease/phosphatase family metal-dependent hydrolase
MVISWNTHVGGGDIPGLVADIRSGGLTDGVPIHDFVLLLQEVYRSGPEVPRNGTAATPGRIIETPPNMERIDIVETARRLGLGLYYVPSMANGRASIREVSEDRGNAILSTLPLDQLSAIELPYEVQRRVAAVATVRGTTSAGQSCGLDLASVHLDHRSRWATILRSVGAGRERQARALVSALEGTDAMAMGGDLNTWAGFLEGAAKVLLQFFPQPERILAEPTFGTMAGSGGLRLDRLMFRLPADCSVTTRRLADRWGSDHHPLLGWMSFGKA